MLTTLKAYFDKVRSSLTEIFGVIIAVIMAILAGLFLYEKTEKDADEAQLKDQKTKDQIKGLDADIQQNQTVIDAEQAKRDAIKKQMENDANEKPTTDELLDYFNKPKSDS